MSELRTNRIVPRDGLPSGASGGGIIQVVQSVVTSSSTGTGATAASVMTCGITPTSSANKILVMVDTNVGSSNGYNTLLTCIEELVVQEQKFTLVMLMVVDLELVEQQPHIKIQALLIIKYLYKFIT